MKQTKILLPETEIPKHWYNVVADLKNPPAPPMGPDGMPMDPSAMSAIFADNIIEQEVSAQRALGLNTRWQGMVAAGIRPLFLGFLLWLLLLLGGGWLNTLFVLA